MAHLEQYMVICIIPHKKFYSRIHSSKPVAKRNFGKLCSEVEINKTGYVELSYRPASTNNLEFTKLQTFELNTKFVI